MIYNRLQIYYALVFTSSCIVTDRPCNLFAMIRLARRVNKKFCHSKKKDTLVQKILFVTAFNDLRLLHERLRRLATQPSKKQRSKSNYWKKGIGNKPNPPRFSLEILILPELRLTEMKFALFSVPAC